MAALDRQREQGRKADKGLTRFGIKKTDRQEDIDRMGLIARYDATIPRMRKGEKEINIHSEMPHV